MSGIARPILRVAVAAPLRRTFDYLAPGDCAGPYTPGVRVKVPFGRTTRVGVLLDVGLDSPIEHHRLRRAIEVLDRHPILSPQQIALLEWASRYYHHPIGEVVLSSLPVLLQRGGAAVPERGPTRWRLSPLGAGMDLMTLARAPRQAAALGLLRGHPEGLTKKELLTRSLNTAPTAMRSLVAKGWVTVCEEVPAKACPEPAATPIPDLNLAQRHAVAAVCESLAQFRTFVLEGVTGSGKTEVYLRVIEEVIRQGKQALVLIPEIGLTPQTLSRFRQRCRVPLAALHSGLTDRERLDGWLRASAGTAAIVIGTRSAVWTPLPRPGVVIVDEEHDRSYKQQEALRYSARDIAIVRAQAFNVPVILGSATPSLESLYHVRAGRYHHLSLPERAGPAGFPRVEILDLRRLPMHGPLSAPLLRAIAGHLERQEQTLLFLNRRGYAPLLLCHGCGWAATCDRCDAKLSYHRGDRKLRCHHCGAERRPQPNCAACGSPQLLYVGSGTERVVEVLEHWFPHARIIRMDRDSTRRRGSMQRMLNHVLSGETDILVGTQMVSKGHDFPGVTLAVIVDGDHGLYGADFRSSERMAQQLIQVAGRAGRGNTPGTVIIQTHHPGHPLLRALVAGGYTQFTDLALEERRLAKLPPYGAMALLRAEAPAPTDPRRFLDDARGAIEVTQGEGIGVFGPVPAPMERRAGRYRWQLLLQARKRAELQRLLAAWIPLLGELKAARRVRWSLDVDPQETC